MEKPKKLKKCDIRLMRIAVVERINDDGWSPVSAEIWPFVDRLPTDLVERERFIDGSGRARLTTSGQAIVDYC